MRRKGYTCVRALFGSLNGLLWVLGCGVVGFAIWLRVVYGGYISLLPQHDILSVDTVILMGGVVLFATAFLGCCGAWCKNRCLLISYFLLVAVLCLLELTGGILGFVYRETVASTLQQELLFGIKEHYNTSSSNGLAVTWDNVQIQLGCCGVLSYEDWYNITAWPDKSYVPHSCCIPNFFHLENCGTLSQISMWYSTGCYDQVQHWLVERLDWIGIVGITVALLQLFGLISSMVLFCAVRRRAAYKTYQAEKSPPLL